MKRFITVSVIAVVLSCGITCSDDKSAVSPETLKKALTADLIVVEEEHVVKGDPRLVVVVGENHANVKTQVQLAALTARLLDQDLVQAVLVEGSDGPFDISRFRDELAKCPVSRTELSAFWRQQLEAGRVAGYEYVVLTRPALEVAGVEDIGAKARYEVGAQARGYQEVASAYDRALVALEQEFDSLSQKAQSDAVRHARLRINEFKEAQGKFARMPDDVLQRFSLLSSKQVELMEFQYRYLAVYSRLDSATPSLEDRDKWVNSLLQPSVSDSVKRDLQRRVSAFDSAHEAEIRELQDSVSRFMALSSELETLMKQQEPFLKRVEEAAGVLEDSFFRAANALQSMSASAGAPRSKVMAFFAEEQERQLRDNTSKEKPFLAERDRAMVANTLRHLQTHAKQRVMLIVGYAHIPGITENLARANISFVSGKLQASEEDIEPWEELAWAFRKRANVPVFQVVEQKLKEVSPLLSRIWQKDQLARLDYLYQAYRPGVPLTPVVGGLVGDSRLFENVGGGNRAIIVGRFPFDRNADYGDHVLDQGSVPGRPDEFYRVFDRDVAGETIQELSDDTIDFAYQFKTGMPGGSAATYRVRTSAGDRSLRDFMASRPGKAKYEVLFGEPDEVQEAGLCVSPAWREMRAGGTPPSEGPPPWTSALADPDDPRRPVLLRTINPRRARLNLIAIEKQQAPSTGDVLFFEDAELPVLSEKLLFTSSQGEQAHMVVLTARNTEEFRASIRKAGAARLLKGKQVALITCGDAFADTAALREDLLHAGVVMVWVNDRQITPEGARRMRDEVKKVIQTVPAEQRKTIEQLMNRSLQNWRRDDSADPDYRAFMRAGSYVDARSITEPIPVADGTGYERREDQA